MAAFVLVLAASAGFTTPAAHAAPPAPQVSSSQYPPSQPGGGVGVAGTFELDGNGDALKFVYSFTGDGGFLDKEVLADAEGNATIQWTPRVAGLHQIYVSAVGRDGGYSPVPHYEFTVLGGGAPAAHWSLDGTLTDTNGQNALTPNGNPDLAAAGHAGRSIRLNGVPDHLNGAALIDTSKNFALSAWAKVDEGGGSRAVVATSDGTESSSGLYYDAGTARWAFGMTAAADKNALSVVRSRDEAETGVWTHLTGTYEATTGTLGLYVDGVNQGEVTGVEGWRASQLLVGRLRWNGAEITGSPGAIDEVRVYARTLNRADVGALARQVGIRGHYRFGEGDGGSTRDEVTGASAILAGNAGWEQDRRGKSLLLNGPDSEGQERDGEAFVSAPSPGIRTDRSFSISAWARLDLAASDDRSRTILSLAHDGTSQLDLRYGGASRKWELVVGGTTVETAYEVEPQEWTYLVAVHDKVNSELRLYLSGVYFTSVPFTGGSARAESTLELGRRSPGAVEGFWKGGIDDVRVYAGALSHEQILAQAVRT